MIFTLLSCLIVATLGIGVLLTVRVQRLRSGLALERYQAALHAQAGIDMAFYRMEHDPDWRTKGAAGTWDQPTPIGSGTYRFTITDPLDGDLTDSLYEPVVISATGVAGSARQKLRVRFDVTSPGFTCLQSAIHAEGDITLKGVSIVSDHWLTAHGDIVATKDGSIISEVYADVAAVGAVEASGGSVFHGATSLDVQWPLSTADSNAVFDYYLSEGRHISITDLPLWGDNLLANPGMEGPPPSPPTSSWQPYGTCTLVEDEDETKQGAYSLRAFDRQSAQAGPSQDITERIASDLIYGVQAFAGSVTIDGIPGRLVIEYESTADGIQSWQTPWTPLKQGGFATLEGGFTPSWSGQLLWARLRLETESSLDDLRLDEVSLIEQTPYPFIRTIHRQVLSPDHNPFGLGLTNPEGIYVIDCQGGLLSIQRSRIVGTLVVLNPHGQGTFIWSVVHWSPAVSNYPAIISDGPINFWLGNEGAVELEEGPSNVNYNPVGAPFNAISDLDKLDTYGSLMRGIVYSSDSIHLKYRPVLEGVLISDGPVLSESTDLLGQTEVDITYLSHYLNDAPPGFRLLPVFRLAPGSFQREID